MRPAKNTYAPPYIHVYFGTHTWGPAAAAPCPRRARGSPVIPPRLRRGCTRTAALAKPAGALTCGSPVRILRASRKSLCIPHGRAPAGARAHCLGRSRATRRLQRAERGSRRAHPSVAEPPCAETAVHTRRIFTGTTAVLSRPHAPLAALPRVHRVSPNPRLPILQRVVPSPLFHRPCVVAVVPLRLYHRGCPAAHLPLPLPLSSTLPGSCLLWQERGRPVHARR